jgi:Immunity protein 70
VSLYLCIFNEGDDDEELAGWQLGHYSDFGCFRDTISRHLDVAGFPILMEHSDCDGEWSVADLPGLIIELETIGAKFRTLPPEEPKAAFEHTAEYREGARSLYECFHNVDGENLFDALITLARDGIRAKRPISFQ